MKRRKKKSEKQIKHFKTNNKNNPCQAPNLLLKRYKVEPLLIKKTAFSLLLLSFSISKREQERQFLPCVFLPLIPLQIETLRV